MPKDLVAGQIAVPSPFIERRIYVIRGQKVMLDSDLAEVYQVPTKALNQAVKGATSTAFLKTSCFNSATRNFNIGGHKL